MDLVPSTPPRIQTNGLGLWNHTSREVRVTSFGLDTYESSGALYAELRVYFDIRTWNVEPDGLIYTDPGFLRGLKQYFRDLGISEAGLQSLNYSEQGMQGRNFVSLDAGLPFITGFRRITGF
jgi:hypothetical protein